MCPLKDKCVDDIRPRWPVSNRKTISTFGEKCEYAHHTFELKFKSEVNARRKILENMLEKLSSQLEADPTKPAFVTGGAVFRDCIGCGEGVI